MQIFLYIAILSSQLSRVWKNLGTVKDQQLNKNWLLPEKASLKSGFKNMKVVWKGYL